MQSVLVTLVICDENRFLKSKCIFSKLIRFLKGLIFIRTSCINNFLGQVNFELC